MNFIQIYGRDYGLHGKWQLQLYGNETLLGIVIPENQNCTAGIGEVCRIEFHQNLLNDCWRIWKNPFMTLCILGFTMD